jgi:hypothetical protein
MEHETQLPVTDRSCPLPFIVPPAFVGTLVWLCTMLARMSP